MSDRGEVHLLSRKVTVHERRTFKGCFSMFPVRFPIRSFYVDNTGCPLRGRLLSSKSDLYIDGRFTRNRSRIGVSFIFKGIILVRAES